MFACRWRDNIYYDVAFDGGYSVWYLDRFVATCSFYAEVVVKVHTVEEPSSIEMVQEFYTEVKIVFTLKAKSRKSPCAGRNK